MSLLPGPDQAGDRVRVLSGVRQVSSLPLSLRGGKLHRYTGTNRSSINQTRIGGAHSNANYSGKSAKECKKNIQ